MAGGRELPLFRYAGCLSCSPAGHLALALLVSGIGADHHHATVATNQPAVVADLLDARLHLHVLCPFSLAGFLPALLVAVNDPAAGEVVR